MKLLVWDLYNHPPPPLQAPLPHTWHPVRWAGVVWKEGQQNFLIVYPCPVSLSPSTPPASNPTRELFLKNCDLPCLKNLRSQGDNQQPNSNSTYIWWPRLRDSNGAILVEGECSHPFVTLASPKWAQKWNSPYRKRDMLIFSEKGTPLIIEKDCLSVMGSLGVKVMDMHYPSHDTCNN